MGADMVAPGKGDAPSHSPYGGVLDCLPGIARIRAAMRLWAMRWERIWWLPGKGDAPIA